MKIEYDKTADAMYIYASDNKVHETKKVNNSMSIDYDSSGDVVGIEVLNVSLFAKGNVIEKVYEIDIPGRADKTRKKVVNE